MRTKPLLALLTGAVFSSVSVHAAVISIADVTATPDGSTTRFGANYNVQAANGGVKILNNTAAATDVEVAYLVATFNFGTATLADIGIGFDHATPIASDLTPSRMGVEARDGGVVTWFGGVAQNTDLGSSLAGQSITLIIKYDFNEVLRGTSTSTVGTFWINPTTSSTEGAGDVVSSAWNSNSFTALILYIDNESTPGTAGASSITNTTLLTGADATFANALAIAIPEPRAALLGVIGLLALLRRRRN